ncbi:YoaK family protein [Antrihabitans stalactiti]|uniref:DUF1275 domain-containing protein n=1 Tax=Antrihabitans stalactiti TaxID=2584121 RepID=A0A848KAL3_9NOCA|nr:YoaK family protein [Antrihabitans stalactiti]NMN94716.1 DUF1275 domain-containing protein [Antrihabitans stalactiti]
MESQTSTTLRFALLLTASSAFLDGYTFVSRDGVFANAQTGNVILLGVNLAAAEWQAAVGHLWPILAFLVGVAFANLLKSERSHRLTAHPIRLAIVAQILVLVAVAFVPLSWNNALVTVPVSFVAAIQMGLFRTVGSLSYMAIATTGNLLRFTEALYAGVVDHKPESRKVAGVYARIISAFAVGAVIGAVSTQALSHYAAFIPAGILAATLVLFYVDEREGRGPLPLEKD